MFAWGCERHAAAAAARALAAAASATAAAGCDEAAEPECRFCREGAEAGPLAHACACRGRSGGAGAARG
jgi:hypothetical protein